MSNQAKVGIVVILAIITLGAVITWKNSLMSKYTGYEMIGSFQNVEGLTVGSEIRYRGFKVGKVIRIDPGPADIKVYCNVDKSITFPEDSYLRVAFDGLVGLKFLEIRPGTSETLYQPSTIVFGKTTSGIVDFVDIGAQNLLETKQILVAVKNIIERPDIQNAFVNAVLNVEKATIEINRLTKQLQLAAESINRIVADPAFQDNFKGTVASTSKTLSSANSFFESFGSIKVEPSGDVLFGGVTNQVKGNIDINTGDRTTLKMSLGEGATRNLSLLDVQISNQIAKNLALRLGTINTYLGGGLDIKMNPSFTLSGDIYDINNPKPNLPKVRVTGDYEFVKYVNLLLQADDFLNTGAANYSFGVRIKGE